MKRKREWPPRVNRTDYTSGTQHWLDSQGRRQTEMLTAEPAPLIWREVNGVGRFAREAKRCAA